MTDFRIGDVVDAYDLRNNTKIEQSCRIVALETHQIPIIRDGKLTEEPKLMAMLENCGYWIPALCLRVLDHQERYEDYRDAQADYLWDSRQD